MNADCGTIRANIRCKRVVALQQEENNLLRFVHPHQVQSNRKGGLTVEDKLFIVRCLRYRQWG